MFSTILYTTFIHLGHTIKDFAYIIYVTY